MRFVQTTPPGGAAPGADGSVEQPDEALQLFAWRSAQFTAQLQAIHSELWTAAKKIWGIPTLGAGKPVSGNTGGPASAQRHSGSGAAGGAARGPNANTSTGSQRVDGPASAIAKAMFNGVTNVQGSRKKII